MPLIGLHLSSNVYICPKGNTLARYRPKLYTDALRYLLALPSSLPALAPPSELSQPPSTEPAPPPPRWCYHQ